ncbi:hypothetical protein [Pseudonocardia sp. TRM90224]|nr:hypothetical protein [Pseudonocardia sp. TRM90224]
MRSAPRRRRRRPWPRHIEYLVAGALLTVVIVDTAYIIGTVLHAPGLL